MDCLLTFCLLFRDIFGFGEMVLGVGSLLAYKIITILRFTFNGVDFLSPDATEFPVGATTDRGWVSVKYRLVCSLLLCRPRLPVVGKKRHP